MFKTPPPWPKPPQGQEKSPNKTTCIVAEGIYVLSIVHTITCLNVSNRDRRRWNPEDVSGFPSVWGTPVFTSEWKWSRPHGTSPPGHVGGRVSGSSTEESVQPSASIARNRKRTHREAEFLSASASSFSRVKRERKEADLTDSWSAHAAKNFRHWGVTLLQLSCFFPTSFTWTMSSARITGWRTELCLPPRGQSPERVLAGQQILPTSLWWTERRVRLDPPLPGDGLSGGGRAQRRDEGGGDRQKRFTLRVSLILKSDSSP